MKILKIYISIVFFGLGDIQSKFDKVYNDLLKKNWKKKFEIENIDCYNYNLIKEMTFEYIDQIEKLYLPVFYKALIRINKNDNMEKMNQYLFDKYSKDGEDAKGLLSQIEGLSKIPYELLCKYYARLYTIESDFYKNINKYLRI